MKNKLSVINIGSVHILNYQIQLNIKYNITIILMKYVYEIF